MRLPPYAMLALCLTLLAADSAKAELPPPPKEMAPWAMPWGDDVPGAMSADDLLEKPAGKHGPVVVRDGHFYSGDARVRWWGFSIAFSGAFPSHEQADEVANRLAHFGINSIRFHHIDMQPYPNGIFADKTLEKFSPEAVDRLDYFIAALKAQGIYSDLNLHVSRWWSKAHGWENAGKLPDYDKMVDLFDPRLIDAQKQYARDLLTHVNAYTHNRYADEPTVCFIEINNENTLFLWGGEQKLAELPEPYGANLTALWNKWLATKYASRDALARAWSAGVQPPGPNLLKDSRGAASAWNLEQHEGAKANVSADASDPAHAGFLINVSAVDGTSWHVQFSQGGLKVAAGKAYTLAFDARADEPMSINVSIGQAHAPWHPLGLEAPVQLGTGWKRYHLGLHCAADDENARVSFQVGSKTGRIGLANFVLQEGGQQGLRDEESADKGTVARGFPNEAFTPGRLRDWYDFLQQTDQAYFVEMRRFLKDDLGVKCPVTGTIGLGPLGTLGQSQMDFVDAHAYWDHPRFPHRQWDGSDWLEKNLPMADDVQGATLWQLAATRVAGKPFTVTEYNHAAPNEWQAECIPMIAAYAAAQDWDGVFLFDYVGANHYRQMDHTSNYFDFEGNLQKMDLMPLGARIFLGGSVAPLAATYVLAPAKDQMLDTGSQYYYTTWPFVRDVLHATPQQAIDHRIALDFHGGTTSDPGRKDGRLSWTSQGPATGSGRFELHDVNAAVFAGFAAGALPIDLGAVKIEKLETPFATLIVVPAERGVSIERSNRLLVCAVARGGNTGMRWDATRHTVSSNWGSAPPTIEVIHATISIAGDKPITAYALTADGKRGSQVSARSESGKTVIELGSQPTIWYELVR